MLKKLEEKSPIWLAKNCSELYKSILSVILKSFFFACINIQYFSLVQVENCLPIMMILRMIWMEWTLMHLKQENRSHFKIYPAVLQLQVTTFKSCLLSSHAIEIMVCGLGIILVLRTAIA
jgi:hypothetical protein